MPHRHWNLKSISSRISTLGTDDMTLAWVLKMLGSVEITDGSVDCTEASVHIIDGGASP